jgi:hypothetical protein
MCGHLGTSNVDSCPDLTARGNAGLAARTDGDAKAAGWQRESDDLS